MADNTRQFVNEAQDATRSMYQAMQGITSVQFSIMQRLGDIGRDQFNQAVQVANDQLQLVGKMRDPREFASAQADLVKRHGQRYVDSIKESVGIVAEAWQEYGDRLENGIDTATDKARQTTSSRKAP